MTPTIEELARAVAKSLRTYVGLETGESAFVLFVPDAERAISLAVRAVLDECMQSPPHRRCDWCETDILAAVIAKLEKQ